MSDDSQAIAYVYENVGVALGSDAQAVAYVYENVGLALGSDAQAVAYVYEDVLILPTFSDLQIERPIDVAQITAPGAVPQVGHLQMLTLADGSVVMQTHSAAVAQLGGRARAYFMESSRRLNG